MGFLGGVGPRQGRDAGRLRFRERQRSHRLRHQRHQSFHEREHAMLGLNASASAFAHSWKGTRHAELVALESILQTHPPSVLQKTDLYVTVEPCIMCASALRQLQIRAVYFGCGNEKFGGNGTVLSVHSEYAGSPTQSCRTEAHANQPRT